jgi:hypothetical protein
LEIAAVAATVAADENGSGEYEEIQTKYEQHIHC